MTWHPLMTRASLFLCHRQSNPLQNHLAMNIIVKNLPLEVKKAQLTMLVLECDLLLWKEPVDDIIGDVLLKPVIV